MPYSVFRAKEFRAGLLFTLIGVAAAYKATDYTMGSATRMGAGYFPELLSLVLVGLGLSMAVKSILVRAPQQVVESRSLLPVFLVISGVFGFALTIDRWGLAPAISILLGCACFQHLLRSPIEVLITILVLIVFSIALFVYGFRMPFSIL